MLNSIESHIGSSCIYLSTTKDIWDHLSHMYSGVGNITRIYNVCKQYFGLEQGAQSVDEYYNQVVAICKERNLYQPLSIDLQKMEKQRQDVDVVRFLLGLRLEFESVRAQILGVVLTSPHFLRPFLGFSMLINREKLFRGLRSAFFEF
jgi:hypothetical protein